MIKKFIYFFVYSLIKLLFNLFKVRLCIISINRIGHLAECYYLLRFILEKKKFTELVYFNYSKEISNKILYTKFKVTITIIYLLLLIIIKKVNGN